MFASSSTDGVADKNALQYNRFGWVGPPKSDSEQERSEFEVPENRQRKQFRQHAAPNFLFVCRNVDRKLNWANDVHRIECEHVTRFNQIRCALLMGSSQRLMDIL